MPKIKLVCRLSTAEGKNFNFSRNVSVESKDLTTFYYAIRRFFRTNLNDAEKKQVIPYVTNKEIITKVKRRKNITLEHIFPADYYVEGVRLVGTNRYELLWGT